ncbi:MAG TPA: manganese efflux pump [Chloroflexota bacterium]
MIKTIGLVLSLGLDTFAVAIGLGLSGLSRRDRLRYGVSFALAEGLMPLAGFFLGRVIAGPVGDIAPYAAVVLLLAVGLYTVWEGLTDDPLEAYRPAKLLTVLAAALSVSLDELAIGLSLGLLGVPILLAVLLIAAQACLLTFIGTAIGRRVSARFATRAELLSGAVLVLLAVALLAQRLLG